MIKIEDIKLLACPRPRFGKGRAYHKSNYMTQRRDIQEQIRRQWPMMPLEGPIRLDIQFITRGVRCGDCDNYVKSLTDAMNGLTYVDDIQICEFSIKHSRGKKDIVTIHVTPLSPDHEGDYKTVKKK